MKRYTVDDILKLNPCSSYTRRKIQKLWGKRKSLSLVSIMKLNIPVEDRFWVARRLLDHRAQVSWACDCAERVLPIFEKKYPENKKPREAIEVTRAWLVGKATLEEVRHAADAAYAANAISYAAYYAAYYATSAACYVTFATNAAHAAASAANAANAAASAASAANAAVYAAERAWQSERMMEYIRGEVKPGVSTRRKTKS